MLSLSDAQFATVFNAAEPLVPSDRSRFLEDVATALAAPPELGDGAIARTYREIQRRYFQPPQIDGHDYSMPSTRGSHSDSSGMYVTITRNTSMASSHGHTATVSSVMPILAMPDAT